MLESKDYHIRERKDLDLTITLKQPLNGRVKGKCKDSRKGKTYYSFTNIPYAEPPIGNKRLQRPEPAKAWDGILNAIDLERQCIKDPIMQTGIIRGTEDCLVLNVYTPKVAQKRPKLLPVLFWIHGGSYLFGSGMQMVGFGALDRYDPSFFIDEDVVVVTINYRLGALGFLTTQDDVIPANLALRDQNLAFQWVRANIDLFGGDPRNIVLMGESVGSCSICYHLLSNRPEMMTAVTGAIMISGSCLSPFGFGLDSKARSNAFMVGRELGLDLDESSENSSTILLEKIQSIPADKFIRIARAPFTPHKGDDGNGIKFAPVFSKDFYPTAPMTDAVDEGNFHKVPLLFGINSEECLTPQYLGFLPQIQRKAIVWDNDISKMIDLNVNIPDRLEAAADMKAIYTNRKFFSDVAAIVKFCTDDEFTLPVGRHAESASKYGIPVYMYQFAYEFLPSHLIPGVEGVAHAEDLFLYWNSGITTINEKLIPNFELIRKRMVKLLSNFVKYKKPVVGEDPIFQNLAWPKFDSQKLQYMKIDVNLEVLSDMRNYTAKKEVYDKYVQKPTSVY